MNCFLVFFGYLQQKRQRLNQNWNFLRFVFYNVLFWVIGLREFVEYQFLQEKYQLEWMLKSLILNLIVQMIKYLYLFERSYFGSFCFERGCYWLMLLLQRLCIWIVLVGQIIRQQGQVYQRMVGYFQKFQDFEIFQLCSFVSLEVVNVIDWVRFFYWKRFEYLFEKFVVDVYLVFVEYCC